MEEQAEMDRVLNCLLLSPEDKGDAEDDETSDDMTSPQPLPDEKKSEKRKSQWPKQNLPIRRVVAQMGSIGPARLPQRI